ncbi:MAG TPA: tetratricopeptide repeat protein [Syntrophaceae bacterium]|nr:tetratricopeptide repeat protein [Syntrophaceae bacterium]
MEGHFTSIGLRSSIKGYTFGQDKVVPPEKTISNATLRLNEIEMPVVEKVFRIDNLDRIGIPAFTCQINQDLKQKLGLTDSFGKGVTAEQAQASALMEAIERLSCMSFLREESNFKIAPYSQFQGKTCSLTDLLLPFDKDYKDNQAIIGDLIQTPLCWTKSFSLTKNKEILYPIRWFTYIYGTTGFAAGNSLEEAILQGICEVLERHSISSVVKEKITTPSIEVNSIQNPIAKELISKFYSAGIELFINDFSLGLGVPTVGILAHDTHSPLKTIRIYNAAGTHLNRDNALIRALIEVAQHRSQVLFREGIQKKEGGPTYCFPRFKSLDEAKYLTNKNIKVKFNKLPSYSHKDFKKEIERTVQVLSDSHFEVVVTDVTHPSLKVPAVMVTISKSRLNRPTTKMNPYFIMARSYIGIGRYHEAIECFEKAFELDPLERENPRMLCRLGLCHKRIKNYHMAAQLFERAFELNPKLLLSKKLVQEFAAIVRQL